MQKVEEEIEAMNLKSVVFDGEMCILDENGDEDFQNCMKQIRRKDHTITNGLYQTFDLIDLPDFQQGTSDDTFFTRLGRLRDVVGDDAKMISVLHQEQMSDNDHFQEWRQRSQDADWEGLMLRLDVPYKGKRSKDILKVKLMHDAEYRVKDTAFGPFRYVVSGREVEEEMLSAVMIEHRGNTVRVGSGFTIEQRQHYFKHPEDIVGKIITTQYFEETKSQQGTFSLRFPVVKVIHGDEREC